MVWAMALVVACTAPDVPAGDPGDPVERADDSALAACAHPKCVRGVKLAGSCDPCVAQICALDLACCSTSWDQICVDEIRSICHSQDCTCAHSKCTLGAKLVKECDACVTTICTADSYCCTTTWDHICVQEVASLCHQVCPAP